MVHSHTLVGVAPGEAAQAEATELAPEAIGTSPPERPKMSGQPARSRGGLSCSGWLSAAGETPKQRLWAIPGEDRRAQPGAQNSVTLRWPSTAGAETVKEARHPRTSASRVVIFTSRFTLHRFRNKSWHTALGYVQIAALRAFTSLFKRTSTRSY
jgi:hypothetical protein